MLPRGLTQLRSGQASEDEKLKTFQIEILNENNIIHS